MIVPKGMQMEDCAECVTKERFTWTWRMKSRLDIDKVRRR